MENKILDEDNILFQNPDPDSEKKPLGLLWSKNFKPQEDDDDLDENSPGENGKFMPQKQELVFDFFGTQAKIVQNAKECCGGYLWRAETVTLKYLENKHAFPSWKGKYPQKHEIVLEIARLCWRFSEIRTLCHSMESADCIGDSIGDKQTIVRDCIGDSTRTVDPKGIPFGSTVRVESPIQSIRKYKSYVLELGAGTGLIGLFLAHPTVGAYVALTDQKSMVPLMEQNVEINNIPRENIRVDELFWGVTDCKLFTNPRPIDYIIACDCIYLEIAFEPLVKAMWDLADDNTTIIIGYQKRRKADKRFWKMAQKKFDIEKIPTEVYSDTKSEPVQIFHLKKKKSSKQSTNKPTDQ